jgi:glycosyl transferase family 25
MNVFVINLAAATERLSFMGHQLGGEFERIEAVKGTAVPERLMGNFQGPTQLLPGEIGCYASHLLAAETVLYRRLPYAVVLEDDVDLADDFRVLVESAVRAIGGDWDILALSGAKQRPHCRVARLLGDNYLVRYLHFPKTTAAYAISQSGCRKLLATRQRNRPVDVDIRYGWEMRIDNGYGVYPPPACQTKIFLSSIPKATQQRFYWRADPLGYLVGRATAFWRLGPVNLIRAYGQDLSRRKLVS